MLDRLTIMTLAVLAACSDTVSGLPPVGGDPPSPAKIERFVRRLHLDLTGLQPPDRYLAERTAELAAANTAAARRKVAADLIAQPAFAAQYVQELENRVFGGESAKVRYQQACADVRTTEECQACPPRDDDACAECTCPALTEIRDEREALFGAAADLAGGDSTSSVERRYAMATPLRLEEPEIFAGVLFEAYLGHRPQDEERRNAAAMIRGTPFDGPAGLLYHRHGATVEDLIEIMFESEVYRQALVASVFERYLGRPPSARELGHFAAGIATDDPDARDLILAVVSSREYFEQ